MNRTYIEFEKCNSSNIESLVLFRSMLKKIDSLVFSDDIHSLRSQYESIQWDDMIYRCFKYSLNLNLSKNKLTEYQNSFYLLFEKTYFQSLLLSIRRITDDNDRSPSREIISIRRVIEIIEDNIDLFTRENYICYNGLPYANDGSLKWPTDYEIDLKHKIFDMLSNKKSNNRSKNDQISIEVIKGMNAQLTQFDILRTYVNKYVAHSSDPNNRRNIEQKINGIDMKLINNVLKTVIKELVSIGLIIDNYFIIETPTVLFDQFLNWEIPLLSLDNKEKLYKKWMTEANLYNSLADKYKDISEKPWK